MALPDEQRVELIDGYFYDMASPTFGHQSIGGEIHRQIANYIMEHGGNCRPFIAPVDVQLDCDERTMVQPDVGIVCDTSKIKRFGIYGAPDFCRGGRFFVYQEEGLCIEAFQVYGGWSA